MAGIMTGFVTYIDRKFREEFGVDLTLFDYMDMTEYLNVKEADYGLCLGEHEGRWFVVFHEDDKDNVRRFCDAKRGVKSEDVPAQKEGAPAQKFLYADDVMTMADMGWRDFRLLAKSLGVSIVNDCLGGLEGDFISVEDYRKIRKRIRKMPPQEDLPVYEHDCVEVE